MSMGAVSPTCPSPIRTAVPALRRARTALLVVCALPKLSKAMSTPPPVISLMASTGSCSREFTTSVAPNL